MRELTFLVAGHLHTRTGGSIYNRRIAASLPRYGWTVDVHELDHSFPVPTAEALQHASTVIADIPSDRTVLIDGLAFGTMPDIVAHASRRLRMIPIVHLPLAAAIGLEPAAAERLAHSECRALSHARRVIVTGPHTQLLMRQHGLGQHDVMVVEPGTDPAPIAAGSGAGAAHLVTVATLNPGKGHVRLLEALAALPPRTWRLTCAGSLTRHAETAAQVRATIARLRLNEHVTLAGELGERDLNALYHRADIAALATLRETYGMSVAEALARGIPVVAAATGAIPALVGDRAGIVFAPGDSAALADALHRMVADTSFRARCAEGARHVRERLPRWEDAAAKLAAALQD